MGFLLIWVPEELKGGKVCALRLTPIPPAFEDESVQSADYEKTIARAFRLLAAKPRSRAELRTRLLERAEEEVVDRVIARLEELRYIDDREFASSYAASRVAAKPLGRSRVRRDLQRRKVSGELAEDALNEVYGETGEEALIDRAISKRIRTRGQPTSRQDAQKLLAHLIRQGFSYDLAIRKVREAGQRDLDEQEQER
ncbi:MAG: RecX family transcriptional regulator [Blastocatellales bacterium]|nr:RecX family transcriptional regulator [Blastocatellales bacterium]